ncbi:9742_t:CDS:2 [Funneliformis geosporum]|nr:9742_t:CDS:2 [Funneliformis geosporum]
MGSECKIDIDKPNSAIRSFIFSPDLNHVITDHDGNLAIWEVLSDDNIVKMDRSVKIECESISLIGLSNKKLLIVGQKSLAYDHHCDYYSNLSIQDMEIFREITIIPRPKDGSFLRLLPNGDLLLLQIPHIYIYSEESLKKSTISPCSFTSRHYIWGVDEIKICRLFQIDERIYFTLEEKNVLLHLNIEKMNIESYHIIPEITKAMAIGSKDCRWEGTVSINHDKSLFAVHLTTDHLMKEGKSNESWIYVFSVKNGLRISSRKVAIYNSLITFIKTDDTEILVLYSCHGYKIEYTIMDPYDLLYEHKGEYEIKQTISKLSGGIQNYMIMKDNSQYKLLLSYVDQIKMVNFSIPKEKIKELYDKMVHNHNLIINSSFNEIKDSCFTHGGFSRDENTGHYYCNGKNLRWEFWNHEQMYGLLVHKANEEKFHIDLDRDLHFQNLKILSNDDIVFYSDSEVHIFGFNEKTSTIVPRYYHHDVEEFYKCKTLPKPSITLLNELPFKNKLDLISEILSSRKNLIEMSDDIIDHAMKRMGNETLGVCLRKLIEAFTDDTITHYRICSIITKYLKKLKLVFPTHYSKFLSITLLIPNPYVHKSYLSDKRKMIGYTEHAYTVQVYKYKFIQKFCNYFQRHNCSNILKHKKSRVISFIIPYLGFTSYPPEYKIWMEIIKPSENQFVTLDDQAFYESWNAEALLNFKWHTFGKFYYCLYWGFFTMFLLSFGIISTLSSPVISDAGVTRLLIISIVLGLLHILHEVRQIIWNIRKYFKDPWNSFVVTAIFWLSHAKPPLPMISLSNIFLHFKFMSFLRAFKYFGSYFTIITGVAKRIFFFLIILFLIIISFALAFYILLTPDKNYDFEKLDRSLDQNNPWNLVNKYQWITSDDKIGEILIQQPDSNTNQFSSYPTSLFAMYLFLTGDSSAFGAWSYQDNPFMTILLTMFSFLIVVYLMNLFIGLLNLEIEVNRAHSLVLLQKAKILAEIELFFLFPNQRRWNHWFPEVIFYEMPIEEVRQKIIQIDNTPKSDNTPHISDKLRSLVDLKVDKNVQMTKADGEELMKKMKTDYEVLLNKTKVYYENLMKRTKEDHENLLNIFITDKDSKQQLLDEIKNLLINDKNIGKEGNIIGVHGHILSHHKAPQRSQFAD